MNINFFTIFKSLESFVSYGVNTHPCDNTNDYFCNFCGETEDDGCSRSCLFVRLKKISDNLNTIKYEKFKKAILEVSEGHTTSTVCHHIHTDFCAFCDSTNSDNHRDNCIVNHVRAAIGLLDEDEDRDWVEAYLNSEKTEELFYEAVKAYKAYKEEIIRIKKEKKRKAAEAIKNEKISRTCRYCSKVMKSKAGRLHHEKESASCRDKFLADHPNYKGN